MNLHLLAATDNLAAGPNLTSTAAIVLSLLGTLFTVWMASKVFHAYARKDWGALVVEILAGVVCALTRLWFSQVAVPLVVIVADAPNSGTTSILH